MILLSLVILVILVSLVTLAGVGHGHTRDHASGAAGTIAG